jgi:hypothetical protein
MKPLRVFIGVDPRQPIAYTVARASIEEHASRPVAISALKLSQLPITRRGLTDFTFARYLVPWLCGYEGHALFLDADTLCRGDIAELPWDAQEAVSVVMHDTVQKNGERVSVAFERPSVMLFNCAACQALTPEYVQSGKPHSLEWAKPLGALSPEWNYLVGYDTGGQANIAHFTMGIPCFEETARDEFADEWAAIAQRAQMTCSWEDIMGTSVHARWKRKPPGAFSFLKMQGVA